jgi:hypothetical protein
MKKRILTRRRLPKIVLGGALFLIVAGAAAAVISLSQPRPAWYVEPGLEQQWGELLERAPAPPPFTRMVVYDPMAGHGKGRCGIIITKTFLAEGTEDPPSEGDAWEPPIRLYPGLYRDRGDYQGAIPLALDPWLVFRKTGDPRLDLERVLNPAGGSGALILPGAEQDAVYAWVTQLLQTSPGSFPLERQAWDDAERLLVYGNRRFQQGALTYVWLDAWIRLLQDETAWVYAPLSRTRGLDSYDSGRLDAAIFPFPGDWNTYGLQAEILWAVPKQSEKPEPKIDEARSWLAGPETQTLLAELLGWIPAQPGGKPHDTLARQAQVAWFSSGFIWQKR